MSITKSQAAQAFQERWNTPNFEAKISSIVQCNASEVDDFEGTSLGVFEIEEIAWRCVYRMRRKILDQGVWTGAWSDWTSNVCHIVEPKPGPYVVN